MCPIFFRLLLTLFLFLGFSAQANSDSIKLKHLDIAFNSIDQAYPFSRYLDGGISVLSGIPAALGGMMIGMNNTGSSHPIDEMFIGYAIATLGTFQLIDGIPRLFGRSSAELALPHYRNFPKGTPKQYGGHLDKLQYGGETLLRLSEKAKEGRRLRALVDIVLAASYLYLYQKGEITTDANGNESGEDIYPKLVYPAIFLATVGIYRFFFKSPEERAWRNYTDSISTPSRKAMSFDIFAAVSPDHSFLGVLLLF